MFVYVAEIKKIFIIGTNFFLRTGIDKIFISVILESSQEEKQEYYHRISAIMKGISDKCKKLFEQNSQEINILQMAVLADLFKEFRDVFSE